MYVNVNMYEFISVCMFMDVDKHVCRPVFTCIRVNTHVLYINALDTRMYLSTCIHIYIYIYIYMYIYIQTH
jgi:hypothetical protein